MPAYILITIKDGSQAEDIWRKVVDIDAVTVAETVQPGPDWHIVAKLFASPARVARANKEIRKIPGVVSTAVAFRRETRQKRRG